MKNTTHSGRHRTVIRISGVIAALIVVALLYIAYTSSPATIAFSFVAFVISIAALVLTTLQSLMIERQMRITKQSAGTISEASDKIALLIKENQKIEHEILEDLKIDHKIIAVLEEYGIGDNHSDREQVASKIAQIVQTSTMTKHEQD